MTAPDHTARPVTPANPTADHTAAAQLKRPAGEIRDRASVAAVHGRPVTSAGVTVTPVAEVGFSVGGGAGREAAAATTGECGADGGVRARPRGFLQIKNGTATDKPLRNPWPAAVVPLAALLAGAALPRLARRLAERRLG
ncbi:sporulation protein [Streptomyces sp. NPDC017993]|uniref:sporulation protein n=1 Tax=Streptomyces sp. NPDC017993 TaxID=3365027 RepID=UPI003799B536